MFNPFWCKKKYHLGMTGDEVKEALQGGGTAPLYQHCIAFDNFHIIIISDSSEAFTVSTLRDYLANAGFSMQNPFKIEGIQVSQETGNLIVNSGIYPSGQYLVKLRIIYTPTISSSAIQYTRENVQVHITELTDNVIRIV